MNYETELRNKNRGYMKLIVWQKAIELFELVWNDRFHRSTRSISSSDLNWPMRPNLCQQTSLKDTDGARSTNTFSFLYYALGSLAETMTRAIGLQPNESNYSSAFP